jgi:hypothetical protein
MEKHFYKKIYNITLCTFWHRIYQWPNTQHIQKLATEDLYILRYCRSRFFTFAFFMQKLTGISSDQNNKSCRIIHNGSNKIGFAFFWFCCDFLRNLQNPAKALIRFKNRFAARTLEVFVFLQKCPCFADKPLGRKGASQCGPWEAVRRGSGPIPAGPAAGWSG